ncbi:MAG: hypothetical protein ACI37Z_08950 [Candidatus Gastranaerophilaceae bacterium]
MSCKNFKDYVEILGVVNDLDISISDDFLGDDYLYSVWYPSGTVLATIKKEYCGYTFLFEIISTGNKEVTGTYKSQPFSVKENQLRDLRNQYHLDDFILEPDSRFSVQYSGNHRIFSDLRGNSIKVTYNNHFALVVSFNYIKRSLIKGDYDTLEEVFVPFKYIRHKINQFILANTQAIMPFKPAYLIPDSANALGINSSLIPIKEKYIEDNKSFCQALTKDLTQAQVSVELSADFLGYEFQNAFWYTQGTILAEMSYKQNNKKCKIIVSVKDSSSTTGNIRKQTKKFTTAGVGEDESIEDLRLFYNLCDRDVIELHCSPNHEDSLFYVSASKFRVDYYVEGQFLESQETLTSDLFEAILGIYLQNFA